MHSVFRLLILITFALLSFYWVAPYFDSFLLSNEQSELIKYNGYGGILKSNVYIYWLLFLLNLLALIGLFFYAPHSRLFFAFVILTNVGIGALSGIAIFSPLDIVVGNLIGLLQGALITLAYFTSLTSSFKKHKKIYMNWIKQYFEQADDFVMPNWEGIQDHVNNNYSDEEQHNLWNIIVKDWLGELKNNLTNSFTLHESQNFMLLTDEEEKYTTLFLSFLERTLTKIKQALPNIVSDEGFGKHVVLIFDDIDTYYSYIANYYSEDGVYGLSAGVYLNTGYGHFAFPHQELTYAEPIAAHELTHALLAHLPIPAWLNEGIAVNMENVLTGAAPFHITDELFKKHTDFWGADEIQEFWSGKSFERADEGQEWVTVHIQG